MANPTPHVAISGIACASALGDSPVAHLAGLEAGESKLRPLSEFPTEETLPQPELPAGWIEDRRTWFRGRRYGAASNAAVEAAKRAISEAGWSGDQTRDAWIFGGSSRANTGEMLGAWPQRRPFKAFAASNSMPSEVAAAVSIELGIRGPWQMLANGCSASLDALGMAWSALRSGAARRALVVGVEIPICAGLLQGFTRSGLLGSPGELDPYHQDTDGFYPGEGVAAIALEARDDPEGAPQILWYGANSDAYDNIALPPEGLALGELLQQGRQALEDQGRRVTALCPHGNGTASNRLSEGAALQLAFRDDSPRSLHFLKPLIGHSLGASGLLETAILAAALRENRLPGHGRPLTGAGPHWKAPIKSRAVEDGDAVLNVALGMGGHNAAVALASGS